MTIPTEAAILETLRQVLDPELGCNIVDLGLIYGVTNLQGKITVLMTLTTPGCPMHESIRSGAQNALLRLDGVKAAKVEVVWDPPWHPSMMTDLGRAATGVGSSWGSPLARERLFQVGKQVFERLDSH